MVYNEADTNLLNYLEDDGQLVEPSFYVPVIPMVLVNGVDGIGSGWSTSIPCYNPIEICDEILALLENDDHIFSGQAENGDRIVNELSSEHQNGKKE